MTGVDLRLRPFLLDHWTCISILEVDQEMFPREPYTPRLKALVLARERLRLNTLPALPTRAEDESFQASAPVGNQMEDDDIPF